MMPRSTDVYEMRQPWWPCTSLSATGEIQPSLMPVTMQQRDGKGAARHNPRPTYHGDALCLLFGHILRGRNVRPSRLVARAWHRRGAHCWTTSARRASAGRPRAQALDARFPLFWTHTRARRAAGATSATQYCAATARYFPTNGTRDRRGSHPRCSRDGRGHLLTKEGEVVGECVRLSKLRMCACVGETTWAVHIAADGVPVSTQLPRRFEVPASVACGEPRVCSQVVFMSQSVPDVPMWAGRMLWCASDLECHAVKNCAGALMLTVPASAAGALCANRV